VYLVLRGTNAEVIEPSGWRRTFTTRKHLAFSPEQAQLIGCHLHFTRGRHTLIVYAGDVEAVWITCDRCKRTF
jgi:hypothetical protein